MKLGKDGPLRRFKWHIAVIYLSIIAIIVLVFFTSFFDTQQQQPQIPQIAWVFFAILSLLALFALLMKATKMLNSIQENGTRIESLAELLEKNRSVLSQINQSSRLSEAAKLIAFRENDTQMLREIVFDRLQQHEFDTVEQIINEIAQRREYQDLAKQLRAQSSKYRQATDKERANQVILHIAKLLDNYQWAKASVRIERLIAAYPDSENARSMRQKLLDKKQERKKILLTAWDDAVKRGATDRSLEILRELDQYLTPNEGLALQEAARDVFRNKLHNLGVQFSLAVSEKNWANAFKTAQHIIRNFPNSRMAEEIRENWDVLMKRAEQHSD